MRLAILDFDGTVIAGNSWHEFFRDQLRRRPLRAPVLAAGWLVRRAGFWDGQRLRGLALSALRGMRRSEVEGFAQDFHTRRLRRLVRPEAVEEIERRRHDGFTTVLATGAWDFIVAPFARELRFDLVVATPVAFEGDVCTGRNAGPEYLGSAKLDAMGRAAAGLDVDWQASAFWTDHVSDAPLLGRVGERWFVTGEVPLPPGLPAGTRHVSWAGPRKA